MLFHGSMHFRADLVKIEHRFWKASVVQTFRHQKTRNDGFVFPVFHQLINCRALDFLQFCIQPVIESKFMNLIEEILHKTVGWDISVTINEGEKILKHSTCRTRCRHKFQDMSARSQVTLPFVNEFFLLGRA